MTSLDALLPVLNALTEEQSSRVHDLLTIRWMEHYRSAQTPMSVWILRSPEVVADVLAQARKEVAS